MVEPARIASKISLVLADADGTLVTKATWLTARENDDERTARRTTLAPVFDSSPATISADAPAPTTKNGM
jgi:hypothetical protein